MSLRRRDSRMEMVEVAARFARTTFTLALTFFVLALIALFLLGVSDGEEVVGAIVLAVNFVVIIASGAVAVWASKEEEKNKTKINGASEAGRKTISDWLNQREEEHK